VSQQCASLHRLPRLSSYFSCIRPQRSILTTRLPFNPRPTTRECVYLVMRGHFRSSDEDGGHSIRSAVVKIPFCMQSLWLYVLENRSYCWSKCYFAGISIFNLCYCCDLVLHPMIFIYELDPYSLAIYRMCKYELPMSMLSKVFVWQTVRHTYKQTDRTEIIYHAASRVVRNNTDARTHTKLII